MKLIDFYKRVIESTGCTIDDQGLVSIGMGNVVKPVFVDANNSSLRLTLPTKNILDNPDWDSICPFHPLSENIVRGESAVLKKLRLMMNARITDVFSDLAMNLMEIGVNHDIHKKLDPKCHELLKQIPNVNEKTIKALSKIFCAITLEGERRLFSIYLKRGGKHLDVNYKRLAVVAFPITESIDAEEKEIYGVKLSTAEKAAISNLFYYILPESNSVDKYSFGSNCDNAPYFHALCGAYIKVIKRLNAVIKLFKKHIEHANDLLTDIGWEEDLENLGMFTDEIPPLPYNDGSLINAPSNGTAIKEASRPVTTNLASQVANTGFVTQPNNYQPQAIIQQPQQPETTSDGKLDFHSLISKNPALNNNGMYGYSMQPMAPVVAPGGYAGYDRGQPVYGAPMNNFNGGYGGYQNNFSGGIYTSL